MSKCNICGKTVSDTVLPHHIKRCKAKLKEEIDKVKENDNLFSFTNEERAKFIQRATELKLNLETNISDDQLKAAIEARENQIEDLVEDMHKGGGYYEMPDGTNSPRGKDEAIKLYIESFLTE